MKTIEVKLYQFEELSDKAKNKARDWYRSCGLDYEWWETTYEDAATIGLKIGSDLERNADCVGTWTKYPIEIADAILSNHGESCNTHKLAKAFKEAYKPNDDEETADERHLVAEFHKAILNEYAKMLQEEYEYLMSDEAVDDSIIANEYEFTEDGKRFVVTKTLCPD